jgi:hypothetical protein
VIGPSRSTRTGSVIFGLLGAGVGWLSPVRVS